MYHISPSSIGIYICTWLTSLWGGWDRGAENRAHSSSSPQARGTGNRDPATKGKWVHVALSPPAVCLEGSREGHTHNAEIGCHQPQSRVCLFAFIPWSMARAAAWSQASRTESCKSLSPVTLTRRGADPTDSSHGNGWKDNGPSRPGWGTRHGQCRTLPITSPSLTLQGQGCPEAGAEAAGRSHSRIRKWGCSPTESLWRCSRIMAQIASGKAVSGSGLASGPLQTRIHGSTENALRWGWRLKARRRRVECLRVRKDEGLWKKGFREVMFKTRSEPGHFSPAPSPHTGTLWGFHTGLSAASLPSHGLSSTQSLSDPVKT